MHLFDPLRPMLNHRPCYVDVEHRRVAVLPEPSISFNEDGTVQLRFMLKVGSNEFQWFSSRALPKTRLPEELRAFCENPEEWLQQELGYVGPAQVRDLDLADLGL